MVDVTAISSALSGLKAAYEITKAIKDVDDATKVQSIVFDLQRVILEAQVSAIDAREAHSAQIDRVRELEAEVIALKALHAEKERYELKMIGNGTFAYMLKPQMRGTEPAHWLCQNCHEHGKKTIFQLTTNFYGSLTFGCAACKAEVHTSEPPQWL